jgi:hypothetical protein
MINEWKLYNFKSVETAELPLSPLTLFAGANSSGKSTFLQSILLISQTLASRVGTQTVILNGHLAKLGQFDDLRNANSDAETIRIAWRLSVPAERVEESPYLRRTTSLESVSCDIIFGVPRKSTSRALQLSPKLFGSVFSCLGAAPSVERVVAPHSVNLTAKPESEAKEPDTESSRPSPWTFDFNIDFDPISLEELRDEISSPVPIGCSLQHFLPQWLIVNFNQKTEIINSLVRPLLDPLRYRPVSRHLDATEITLPNEIIEFLNNKKDELGRGPLVLEDDETARLANVLPWLRGARPKKKEKGPGLAKDLAELAAKVLPEKVGVTTIEMPSVFRDALEYVTFFFSRSMRYLGPLREEPKSMYPLETTADPQDIGLHGEHLTCPPEISPLKM